MGLENELTNLIERCAAFHLQNPAKAGRNLSNAGVYLVSEITTTQTYPLHWLLHVRNPTKAFTDTKRSNQNLKRHIPALRSLGISEIFPGEAGFDQVWEAVLGACSALGTAPSNRSGGPNYIGRRFFAFTDQVQDVIGGAEVNETALQTAAMAARAFQNRINAAGKDTIEARRKRLAEADPMPERVLRVVEGFRRNPDVVAERLHRANGTCDGCNAQAPFLRASDKTPYLEVHHRVPLAQGGPDTVENTQALCPNCHRQVHFG